MRHEMLTQRAPFCIGAMAKKGTLSQHFVTHVVPPLGWIQRGGGGGHHTHFLKAITPTPLVVHLMGEAVCIVRVQFYMTTQLNLA